MKLTRRAMLTGGVAVAACAVIPWTITAHAAEIKTDDTPTGWLKCEGQQVSIYNYPDLYTTIKNDYISKYSHAARPGFFIVPDMRYTQSFYSGNNSGSIPIEFVIKATGDDVGSIHMWSGVSTVRGQRV